MSSMPNTLHDNCLRNLKDYSYELPDKAGTTEFTARGTLLGCEIHYEACCYAIYSDGFLIADVEQWVNKFKVFPASADRTTSERLELTNYSFYEMVEFIKNNRIRQLLSKVVL